MIRLFFRAKIISSGEILTKNSLLIDDSKIIFIGTKEECLNYIKDKKLNYEEVDCKNNYLSSGFIDLHCHGGGGYDFMDGDDISIIKAAQLHLKHGTTSIYPTSMTSDNSSLFTFFDNYRKAINTNEIIPNFLGLHLEGPFFSPKQCGAQDPNIMQLPTLDNVKTIWEKGKDIIKRWSIAPELEGGYLSGDFLASKNIHLSMGHSDATYSQVKEAIKHGYSHVTHLYSGMSTITRKGGFRVLGLVESAYLFDQLSVELIADGKHLPPELLQLIIKTKDNSKICLITDSMRGAGEAEGPSILGNKKDGLKVFIEDGIAKTMDKTCFAGSVATTDRLVRTMVQQANLPIEKAVQMMSENPAKFMKIDKSKGNIKIGLDADLIIFDENINIQKIYILGKEVK
ncbi:MAG: N-acetylglucosamine-6-phosphate deacetylase [Pleomorphochaeta sp.]